jgi:hypothetical protein
MSHDGRVTNGDGRPVRSRQADSGGGAWWFRVRRPEADPGVELITSSRSPWGETITRHATQEEADAAAREMYEAYRADMETRKQQEVTRS